MGVEGLAVGVVIGPAHLAIQLPSLARVGRRYDLTIGLAHPGVRQVAWLMGPRTLGLAAGQLNFLVSTVLASGLVAGSLTAYNYAFQLSQIPVGVIGVSIAVALFPTLSRDAALGRIGEIRRQVAGAVRVLVFVAAPLMAIMIVLREPLTVVFYQYGLFSQSATERTASTLACFAIGLVGHIVVHVLTRAFYAMQDTRTPVMGDHRGRVERSADGPAGRPMGVEGLALALSDQRGDRGLGLLWSLRADRVRRRRDLVRSSGPASPRSSRPALMARRAGPDRRLARSVRRSRAASFLGWRDRRHASCWSAWCCFAGAAAIARRVRRVGEPHDRLRPATDADASAWQAFLGAHASGDFHDWAWADVAAFDGQPQRRFSSRRTARSSPPPPQADRSSVAREFWYVPHGPVLDYADPGGRADAGARHRPARGRAPARAIAGSSSRASRTTTLRWRSSSGAACGEWTSRSRSAQTRIVELADDDEPLAGFDKDTRYSVRRAEREGVEVAVVAMRPTGAIDGLHALVAETQAAGRFRCRPRALPDRVGSAGRRGPRRDPRGAARGRAARVRDGRDRGRSVVLPVQRLSARGARRAEALRQLRAPVGDDAARPRARRPASRPVGRALRRTPDPTTRGTASGSSRRASAVARCDGPDRGTSSSTRPCTGCAPRPASRAGGCEASCR